MHQTWMMRDFAFCNECVNATTLIFLTEFTFAVKNENLTRFKKQQSAEHTAELHAVERTVCCSRWHGILLLQWCLLGISRRIHHAEELLSQAWAHYTASVDSQVGAAHGEQYRCLCTVRLLPGRCWCRYGAWHQWTGNDAKDCSCHVAHGKRQACLHGWCSKRLVIVSLKTMPLKPI